MEYKYDCQQTKRALDHLARCQNHFDFGSPEYVLAEKAFAWIANKCRENAKLEIIN